MASCLATIYLHMPACITAAYGWAATEKLSRIGLGVETERVPRVETERGMLGSL